MAKTIPFTEARSRLSELLDDLEQRHEHVVITRNGRPAGVLIPAAELEAIEETLEILQKEDLKALPRLVQEAVDETLTTLEADPESVGKELRGQLRGLWSCRVGSYRILYTIERSKARVRVIVIVRAI